MRIGIGHMSLYGSKLQGCPFDELINIIGHKGIGGVEKMRLNCITVVLWRGSGSRHRSTEFAPQGEGGQRLDRFENGWSHREWVAGGLRQRLRTAGLRVTRPRVAVLYAVHANPHSDTETIIRAVRDCLPDTSRQTVYDILPALTAWFAAAGSALGFSWALRDSSGRQSPSCGLPVLWGDCRCRLCRRSETLLDCFRRQRLPARRG